MAMMSPLPVRDGVGATRLHLPLPPRDGTEDAEGWSIRSLVSDYMVSRFGHLDPDGLRARFDRGEIVGRDGSALTRETRLGEHEFVWYYREPPVEREIPFEIDVLHIDDDLVVADKPHFLPTTPGGKFLQNSALVRLRRRLGNDDLTPIHRLDRATAGLLMFSARPATRGAYQLLFERREVEKVYEAVSDLPSDWNPDAPALNGHPFPITFRNRIEKQRGHVRVHTSPDAPNAETLIELIGFDDRVLHTELRPHSGKMHQLRVHLSELGAGIRNDGFYPDLLPETPDDFARPMQLLARELHFVDPLSRAPRVFRSQKTLQDAPVRAHITER